MTTCLLHPDGPPLEPALVTRFAALASTVVSDELGRGGALLGLRRLGSGDATVVGRAFTIRTRPGDNLVVHHALDLVGPDDFVIVDAGGAIDRAIVGAIMCRELELAGVAGVAVWGAVRDRAQLEAAGLPVFASGACPHGPLKSGPGELRGRVAIAGVVVEQGDVVVADADGVVVVPRAHAAAVVDRAEDRGSFETRAMAAVERRAADRAWLADALDVIEVTGS